MKRVLDDLLKQSEQLAGAVVATNCGLLPELPPLLDAHFASGVLDLREASWGGQDVFHPSAICDGVCPRFEQIRRIRGDLLEPARDKTDSGLQRVFLFGSVIHQAYQNLVFGPMGLLYGVWRNVRTGVTIEGLCPAQTKSKSSGSVSLDWKYVEPSVYIKEYKIGGHCDGVLRFPDAGAALLEIKTMNSWAWDKLTEPLPKHVRQAQLYMHGELGLEGIGTITRTLFLYVNKNNSREKLFLVDRDTAVIRGIFEDLRETLRGIGECRLSTRQAQCSSGALSIPQQCAARVPCFSVGSGKHGWAELLEFSDE